MGDYVHRHEYDIEVRTPSHETVMLAQIDAQAAQVDAFNRDRADRQRAIRLKQSKILESPRFSRPGWFVVAAVEVAAVLFAASVLFSSGVGFTRTSVCFALAALLIPTAIIAGIYAIFDADVKNRANKVDY